jgi:hypothetical protein
VLVTAPTIASTVERVQLHPGASTPVRLPQALDDQPLNADVGLLILPQPLGSNVWITCRRIHLKRRRQDREHLLEQMTTNTCARLVEAKDRGWLGEVSALEDQLKHLRIRTAEVETRRRVAP